MKLVLAFFLITLPVLAVTPRSTVTADQQMSGSKADVELTRKIRERLVKDDSLSVYAENITIVTVGQNVTLKGEVTSKEEGERIATIARSLAGARTVNNQLVYRQ